MSTSKLDTTPDMASEVWLSPQEVVQLRGRSNLMGLYLVVHAWLTIAAAMAMFNYWPNPVSFVLAFMVIGNRQLGLAILMHDAAHRLLFANAKLNDWFGNWCCGAPVGASLRLYRPYHLSHHRHTQQTGDPDLSLSAPFPITRASFRRKILRDLFCVTGYQRRVAQFRAASAGASGWPAKIAAIWQNEKAFLSVNLLLLLVLWLVGYGWLYVALWVLPMLSWYQLISRIRNIAEHAVVGQADDTLRNTRTTRAGPIMRLLLAPYWVNYHLEHHLFVFTPCWKLPQAHRLLCDRGLQHRMELASSYREVIRKATSRPPDQDVRGPKRDSFAQI